ncbi:MAG: flagellar basal body-associated protein FliL [Rheinheimera sp.]|uniref:flagellar basal body-associated protein FliL n=1 Tax=Arsukibacterium sp. UBA3155 TaxID=1946058 RepID=UPI000C91BE33|nr:flagellar basal body-associated protein FliL [Arsukibacterium sp. UBA3155]MAD74937.1 flagellar basal body-associated protein FliL [Rheinheimera sp.]|tara:strand:- start:176252 stop:176782 length:531 start_codon:yes stop_codon:yes gene_type:complete
MAADGDLKLSEGKGGIKKIMLLVIAVLVLLVLAAGAYFYFLGSESLQSAAGDDVSAMQGSDGGGQPSGPEGNALYVAMPRPFVFNVPGAARDRLVQIKVQLLVRGSNNETIALRHIPLIEASLVAAFASANADELITTTGKDALKNKALSDLQQALLEVAGSVVVEEVLFTSFVMQ